VAGKEESVSYEPAETMADTAFDPEFLEAMPDRRVIEMQNVDGIMQMRPYQGECVDTCFEAWREFDAIMIVLATGLGKTIVAADIINRWPEHVGRVLFIAHMQELIFQAQDKIGLHTDERPSIEMGMYSEGQEGHELLDKSKCLVASIQTMTRRMKRFDPKNFSLIIIDEFHHAGAQTYRRLWEYFKTGNPHIKMLGITATPYRGDNVSLGCIAEHCPFEMGIREGIDEGWLVPIEQQYIVVDHLDFSKCRTVAKDLNEGDLEEAMMGEQVTEEMTEEQRLEVLAKQERMLHSIAAPTVREPQGRATLVFCVTCAHAERMAEVLRRYPGVTAEVLLGTTPADERADRIDRFNSHRLQMLVVVGCYRGIRRPERRSGGNGTEDQETGPLCADDRAWHAPATGDSRTIRHARVAA
jgi:ATP-dependent helicase IRC3